MNCVTPPRRSVSRTRCHWCFGQTKLSSRSLSLESPRLLEGPAYGGPDGMPVEFNVTLQDRPGTLARLGQMLGEAAVNIEAIQGMSREGHGFIHFVPRDPQQAARVLDAAGIGYSQREVLIVKVINTASPTVLRAFGLAEAEISEILQNRRYGPYTDVSRV